jgi:hypothetical protein
VQIDGDPAGYVLPASAPGGRVPTLPPGGAAAATTRDRWTIEVVPAALKVLVAGPSGVGRVALAREWGFR